jgi:thiol-disulfide isomerase/thioredoxin
LFFDFKNLYPQSVHLAGLQSFRQKLLALLPGQPAPPIRAATLQGDTVDLSTFKNKVVYIDIWASWCVPCVAEIPHAKKLQAAFKGNDSVVFVNISVGDPYDHWKQALQKYEGWNGLHLRHDGSLYETFQMRGIPVYILIDKNGNLVSADATRPSNPETEKTIRKLL